MAKKSFKFIIPALFISISFLMTGCESSQDNAMAAGQECLDHATTEAQATTCINEVAGYSSPQAYLIRCSANLIAQGFTGQRFTDALAKIDDKDSSKTDAEKTSIILSYFVFPSENPIHSAEALYENCKNSGDEGVTDIAAIVKISTILARAVGGGVVPQYLNPNSPDFNSESFISSIKSLDPATLDTEALGTVVKVVANSYCEEGSKHRSDSFCVSVVDAVNSSSDLPSLGEQLIRVLKELK